MTNGSRFQNLNVILFQILFDIIFQKLETLKILTEKVYSCEQNKGSISPEKL